MSHSILGVRIFRPVIPLLVIVCSCILVVASVAGRDLVGIYGGHATFGNPDFDSLTLIDFYFSVPRNEFDFFRPDSADPRFYARVFAQVELFGTQGLPVDSASTYFSSSTESVAESKTPGVRLFNSLSLLVGPGIYSARLTIIDAVSKRKGSIFFDHVVVDASVKGRLSLGGIIAAYKVQFLGDEGRRPALVKNGWGIVPNPLAVLSKDDTTLSIYSEIYNLRYETDVPSEFSLSYSIVDSAGMLVRLIGSRTTEKPGYSAVIAESFDVKGLALGSYQIKIEAVDILAGDTATSLLPFLVLSPDFPLSSHPGSAAAIDPYDDLTFNEKLNLAYHFLSPEEKAVLKKLTDAGKVTFLDRYWQAFDDDDLSNINTYRLGTIERYNYSNKFFSSNEARDDGWQSDQGRIYMKYGRWDERDRNTTPRSGPPYEIWHYRSIKGGAVFVFEDWMGSEDYRLVHSNMQGEIYSKGWNDRIWEESLDIY